MKRLSLNHLALMLPLGLFGMNNCMNSTTLRKIIGRLPPTITIEATKLRQISEEMSIRMARMAVYERLLGPTSDWVNGTRLLTQSYEDAAREHEQKAREHLELIHASRPPSVVRTQSR